MALISRFVHMSFAINVSSLTKTNLNRWKDMISEVKCSGTRRVARAATETCIDERDANVIKSTIRAMKTQL